MRASPTAVTAAALTAAFALLGCASEPEYASTPEYCWAHESGNNASFNRDNAECNMVGDAAGGYITGGLAGAVAAKRRHDFCMQSKGYYLVQCTPTR